MIKDIAHKVTKLNDISLEVYNGDVDSVIFLKDTHGIIGRKYYTRKIHKYESNSDFTFLSSELLTYGYQQGLLPLWEHINSNRSNK